MPHDEPVGMTRRRGKRGDREAAGVGRQDRRWRDDLVQLAQDGVLEREILADGLDDEVSPRDIGDLMGEGQTCERLRSSIG